MENCCKRRDTSTEKHVNAAHFVKRQSIWLGIGIVVCIAASRIDYHWWQKTCGLWFGA